MPNSLEARSAPDQADSLKEPSLTPPLSSIKVTSTSSFFCDFSKVLLLIEQPVSIKISAVNNAPIFIVLFSIIKSSLFR